MIAVAVIALAIWGYLLTARGGFWRCNDRDDWTGLELSPLPHIAAVVPARNEAATVAESVGSLLRQEYRGAWTVIVVDDDSSDATAEIVRGIGHDSDRLHLVTSRGLPSGWTGKLWALKQGIEAAMALPQSPDYLLLSDADIVHPPDSVSRLVGHAHPNGLVLTSLMVKLRCETFAERATIPAFIFFFQMLYPFAWVNEPRNTTAAAAGGCMLVRADALHSAGGIEAVSDALIDDCALARALKKIGPVWLALTDRVRSIRSYPSLADIRRMVVRSAYAQLYYSPLMLLVTVAGMAVTFCAAPFIGIFGSGSARAIALATWLLMAFAFQPILRFYRLSLAWGIALPGIALLYLLFTLESAYQYARGRGGTWKGRVQADVSGAP
jgi:hopene-associated glycosyltransferase HpnB